MEGVMPELDKFGLPIALLLAVWGAFEVILKTVEMQNKSRDEVRDEPRARRMQTFWADWFWLWLGSLWFLAIFTTVLACLPAVVKMEGWTLFICLLAASMPGFAFLAVLIGGSIDIKVFTRKDGD
jgi:hypothetical protein